MSKASSRSSAAASSTLGLDGLGDLSALLETPVASGRPLELKLEEIAEDPNQPRVEFDEESLAELAESIRQRGVKTPISVRPVKKGGGYMINHGARRFRASRLAGSETIPVYVDDDYTDEDQIIENIHRDALRPREIADYIGRKLAQGKQQKDIAKGLGKSKGWVSQHAVLLDLPEPIAAAFREGRATDVTAIYELVNCHKEDPEGTVSWMAAQEISRGTVKKLKEYLATREKTRGAPPKFGKADGHHPNPDDAAPAGTLRKPIIGVECEQKKGTLLYTKRPTKNGCAWVRFHNAEKEVKIEKIKLISLS